jgi:transposase-like protein
MASLEEVIRISKSEFDSLCPYCKSRAIYLVGAHRTELDAPGNRHASEAYIEDWRCAICNRSFELS